MDKYLDRLDTILTKLFDKYTHKVNAPGVLLSGGIDSSTISYFVSKYFTDYHLFTMGTDNGKDREFAAIMSSFLHRQYHWVDIAREQIQANLQTVADLLKKAHVDKSLMQVSLGMGYFLTFQEAEKMGIKTIFTGQGPDIIFAGYHKYKSSSDINSDIKRDLELLEVDKRRDQAMASYFGINLIHPYLEPELVEFSLTVPSELKLHNGVEKYILRQYAKKKGLPPAIIRRPKKAFQYSTGVQSVVSKLYNTRI